MRRFLAIVGFAILAAILIGVVAVGPVMSHIEIPAYTVARTEGPIEMRAYPALTVATVSVGGSRGSAVNQGFRTLADYIFGANERAAKIEMTAPVLQSRESDAKPSGDEATWVVRFVMPHTWSKDRLPKPNDPRVHLDVQPPTTFAVIRFSGLWRDALLARKTAELEAFIQRNGLPAKGPPIYAFYNPPWTLPPFRRNEVMIEVAAP